MTSQYLTRAEVAKEFRISERTLERMGPAFAKIGQRVVYSRSDVEEWLARHRVNPLDAGARPLRRGRPTKAEQRRRRLNTLGFATFLEFGTC
jgi:hypothetical protein